MEKILPKKVYSLGDYYMTEGLRETCHEIKENPNCIPLLKEVAKRLAALIPKDALLVPVPCSNSYYTDKLCMFISSVRWPGVIPAVNHYCNTFLDTVKDGSLYDKKKAGLPVTEEDCKFVLTGHVPNGRIVLVDNVLATGTTASAAMRCIGRQCELAVIAVDEHTFCQEVAMTVEQKNLQLIEK